MEKRLFSVELLYQLFCDSVAKAQVACDMFEFPKKDTE